MEQKQKAIIAGINRNKQHDFEDSMKELRNLADACNIDVVGEITQNLNRVNNTHYFGKGKLEEVLILLEEKKADMVIFDDELSPSQMNNLNTILECKIIDRTVLILDIFAQRAQTREAKLQVEIATLQYKLPRLSSQGEALSRQGGGAGLINRGSGETKLELDRRKLEDRISGLHKELETLVNQRQNQRKKRKKEGIPVIALVGYTNAGKSTIMNAMIDVYHRPSEKQVFEKDMLFATLETSVRNITLPDNKSFLLTDTVGFINKLPHQLVKAFRSTLEEVAEADLLIHVVDSSNPNYKRQIKVTQETLQEIGVEQIPIIYAYNKTDLVESETAKGEENCVYISAKNKEGMDTLVDAIKHKIFMHYIHCHMLIPYHKGNVVSYLNDNAKIKTTEYNSDGILIYVECKESDYKRYEQYVIQEKQTLLV